MFYSGSCYEKNGSSLSVGCQKTLKTPCTGRGLFQEHHGWSSTKSRQTTKDMDIFSDSPFFLRVGHKIKRKMLVCVYIYTCIALYIYIYIIYISYVYIYILYIHIYANSYRKQLRPGYSLFRQAKTSSLWNQPGNLQRWFSKADPGFFRHRAYTGDRSSVRWAMKKRAGPWLFRVYRDEIWWNPTQLYGCLLKWWYPQSPPQNGHF